MICKNKSWQEFFDKQEKQDYYKKLKEKIETEYNSKLCYPAFDNIYNAFELCDYDNIKVAILGQDPYHEEGQAMGLAFAVPEGITLPPSLRNIYKELDSDLTIKKFNGDLSNWAKQGVLLINSVLSVEAKKANSHKGLGWEELTDNLIMYLSDTKENLVFVLWGNNSIKKSKLIDENKHFIVKSPHPSPLSAYRGFWNSKPFSKINNYLEKTGQNIIDWKK